jgi:hypothetical protein
MSNYIKSVDFAAKDDLVSGDPGKIIKGTEINTEYNNIATAVTTKAENNSPAFTGNPTATTQTTGNNTTRLATTAFVSAATVPLTASIAALQASFDLLYPVGSIYTNAAVATNPATLLGFGTWATFGSGRVLVGLDAGQTEFDTLGETGGAKTHTLTVPEMPSHSHTTAIRNTSQGVGGGSGVGTPAALTTTTSSAVGGGTAHNILQPYVVVYQWQRTA